MKANAILVFNTNKVLAQNSRDSFKDAARRWDADYIEITEDSSPYHHAALKLRAFEFCDHENILVLDSDTIVKSSAYSIFEIGKTGLPTDFYAVKNQQPHYPPAYRANVDIARRDLLHLVELKGLQNVDVEWLSHNFFNSGVFLVNRTNHTKLLEYAFYIFEGASLQWWDQLALNVAVHQMIGEYVDIGVAYNFQFPSSFHYMDASIYHFAGDPTRYENIKRVNWFDGIIDRTFLPIMFNARGYKLGVEVGSQRGEYALQILQNTTAHLWMIDAWRHLDDYKDIANVTDEEHLKNMQHAIEITAPFEHRRTIIHALSTEAAQQFKPASLDFAYIDANHNFENTKADLEAWYPLVRVGGMVCGHDFLDGENICGSEFGVRSAVLEFLQESGERGFLNVTREAWPSWYFTKV